MYVRLFLIVDQTSSSSIIGSSIKEWEYLCFKAPGVWIEIQESFNLPVDLSLLHSSTNDQYFSAYLLTFERSFSNHSNEEFKIEFSYPFF